MRNPYLIRRASVSFILLGMLTMQANSLSASVTSLNDMSVNLLQAQATTVKDVLSYVEKHSKYVFLYGPAVKDRFSDRVRVSLKGNKMLAIVKDMCSQTGMSYQANGRQISIFVSSQMQTETQQNKGRSVSSKPVSGRVTDETGEPLVGATVKVKGTSEGTVTDLDGRYTLDAADGSLLEVSYIGFTPQSLRVGQRKRYDVRLSEDHKTLEELVVVGYGTMKKKDLTGGVSQVSSSDLERVASYNLMDKVAGQIAGLNVTTSNAAPGQEQSILVRGINSLSADNSPLVVLDGIPYNGAIGDLDPTNIESLTVLKDASAAAIYGSRGSNGVILIESKKGHKGAPHVTYHTQLSISEPQQRIDVMGPAQYIKFKQDIASMKDGWTGEQLNPENILSASELINYKAGIVNDWQDIIFRTVFSQNHSLSMSGGTDFTTYHAAISYLDDQGVVYNSDIKKYNFDLNVQQVLNDWLTVGIESKFVINKGGGITPNIEHAVKQSPYGIYKDERGNYYEEPMDQSLIRNPMVDVNANQNQTWRNTFVNAFALIKFPIRGLSYRTNFGYDYRSGLTGTYYGRNTFTGKHINGKASINNTHYQDYTWENILKYERSFGKHAIDLTGLFSLQKTKSEKSDMSGEDFVNDDMSYHNIGAAETNKDISSSLTKTQLLSYMFRVNYNYDNRYLLTITGRTDGYSAFGENDKYAFFPSVAGAWNIYQEKFMAGSRSWLDQLKLRVSYGSNGNQAISPYQTVDRLYLNHYVWGNDAEVANAVYLPNNGVGNPNLKWETTHTFNVGIDFSFLNGRIFGSIDTYVSNTKDLLMQRSVPIMNGYSTIWDNIGKTRNKGVEITLNTVNVRTHGLEWKTGINFSLNRDKIVELRGDGKDDINNKWFIGHPLRVYYDYKAIGIWQEGDVYSYTDEKGNTQQIQKGAKPGSAKLLDANHDGVINSKDKVIIGSKSPSFLLNMSNELTYKDFWFSFVLDGTFRVTRELNEANIGSWSYNIYNYLADADYWTPTHTNAKYTAPTYNNFDGHSFYHKFTYVKLKNITLGYNINKKFIHKVGLSNANVSFSVNNAYTFCDIRSVLNYDNSWFASYPTARSYVFGLNVTF